jgi:hypothetical protein
MPRQLSQTCSSAATHERVRQTLSCWLVRTPVLCLSGRRRSITVVLSLSVSSRFALVRCHYTSPAGLLCAPVLCRSGRRQSLASVLSQSLSPCLDPTPASASRSCRQLRLPTLAHFSKEKPLQHKISVSRSSMLTERYISNVI